MIPQQTASTAEDAEETVALAELMFPTTTRCVSVAAEHGIADLLADGPLTVQELARRSRTDAHALTTVLRLLAHKGVFAEVDTEVFANTPMSDRLRPGVPGTLYSMAKMVGEHWLWTCWGGLDGSVSTGRPAFDEAFGTNLWSWLPQHPASARLFNDALGEFSTGLGPQLVRAYPEFGKARVVADLGGGLGDYLAQILEAFPSVGNGVLVDTPAVIDQARGRPELAGLVEDGRLGFAPGDFFAGVPEGVDIYVTKQIMHSWQDDQIVKVLERCRAASPTALVVAAELVDRPGATSFVRHFDLVMLVTMSGHVRSAEQFAHVYERAGYRVTEIVPTGGPFSLIVGTPVASA
jgi:hypothetical protein